MGIHKTPYGTWIVRWTDPWSRQKGKTFKTKGSADRFPKLAHTGTPLVGVRGQHSYRPVASSDS